jgi:hypothetical protein
MTGLSVGQKDDLWLVSPQRQENFFFPEASGRALDLVQPLING